MSQTYGKTRWKRFAVVMVPSIAATAAIGVSLAQGALAASFNVSGQQFKVGAGHLEGNGFAQYGSLDVEKAGVPHPVAVSSFRSATINNLCQSVVLDAPLIGKVSLNINAGGDPKNPVEAKNLFIDLDDLNADATFSNINIGVATGSITKGDVNAADRAAAQKLGFGDKFENSFAQEADKAVLDGVQQTAWATSAGTFKLSGLHLAVKKGVSECF
ncbi:DUF6230 family protein [Streptacidiphilus sp. ASG 303]|uniref:DUF6230 family protein n=1 Tax=Streptacidiphilus sp. ASG 303 TaxID=2896847 RepID=UPI001E38261E|nr:DUF6230 family protein [Streptacidiphilus sp. ASG 303]MCD0482994.1 DUF6230 family protein [Streptacidiphilus sp. ASG 303]